MKMTQLEKALEMPPSERVAFSELILTSIELEDEGVRQSWILEIKDRIKAVN